MQHLITKTAMILALFSLDAGIAQDYIKPAPKPDRLDYAYRRITQLEAIAGHFVHDFEYSLPLDTKLMLSVIVRRDGKVSEKDSGTFHVTAQPGEKRNRGIITASQIFGRGQEVDAAPMYYISVDGRYQYGFRYPREAKSAIIAEKGLDPATGLKDQQLFLVDYGPAFSLEFRACAAALTEADKPNSVRREPYASE